MLALLFCAWSMWVLLCLLEIRCNWCVRVQSEGEHMRFRAGADSHVRADVGEHVLWRRSEAAFCDAVVCEESTAMSFKIWRPRDISMMPCVRVVCALLPLLLCSVTD